MAEGYLILQARTAHEALPLSGVRIQILDGKGQVVYDLTTDESGDAGSVSLTTLERSLSLNPDYSGAVYVSYYVTAQKEGFNSIYISGIPIYEGETAIQPLVLVPMQADQRSPVWTEIVIGKPAVATQEGHFQPGPKEEEEPQILRHVVIPNPITVHLGSPSSWAADVQVSFPDYIKNVASSEIYPTWPEAALRANIYAIITFALNRVFTEWWRSHGSFGVRNPEADDGHLRGDFDPFDQPVYQHALAGVVRPAENLPPGCGKPLNRRRSALGVRSVW